MIVEPLMDGIDDSPVKKANSWNAPLIAELVNLLFPKVQSLGNCIQWNQYRQKDIFKSNRFDRVHKTHIHELWLAVLP